MNLLEGKKGLIIGVANKYSIATGCAEIFSHQGADLALTYLNEKAKPFVKPIASSLQVSELLELDLTNDSQCDAVFETIEKKWGKLDFLLHSVAFCPMEDLHGRVIDCSKKGFLLAMDISCHSFIRVAHKAESLMKDGGSILTLTYYGSNKAMENYNIMGPVKAALESTTRYLAMELGGKKIRVNAISSGPIATRAASGINQFDKTIHQAIENSAEKRIVTPREIGGLATFLVSDLATAITGGIHYADAGLNITA